MMNEDTDARMERPTTFRGWVDLCLDRLAVHEVRETLVTEEKNGKRSDEWTSDREFEQRFQRILKRTTRSWVNLHIDSVDDGVLRLVVEYISRDDQAAVSIPADKISVNFSGPEGGWSHLATRRRIE